MRRALIVLTIVLGALSSCELATAQGRLPSQPTTEKNFTTAVDTTVLTTKDLIPVEIFVLNSDNKDTLQYRTENQATYRTLLPGQNYHGVQIAKWVYVKAKSDTVTGKVWGN